MFFQGLMITIATLSMVACASKQTTTTTPNSNTLSLAGAATPEIESAEKVVVTAMPVKKSPGTFLICKAKKSRFHYDWDPNSLASGQADQNTIRFEFRQASRPAGAQGENLKVGECGWADQALAEKKSSAQVTFKSLSDEATQSFYKLKTGKVFKFPVRQSKNGLQAAPGSGLSVVR